MEDKHNPQEDIVSFNVNNINIDTICFTDDNGMKQGVWHELDTIHSRVKKITEYKNNELNGNYLEYKTSSSDSLVFGHYKNGEKDGKWIFWNDNQNIIERIENY